MFDAVLSWYSTARNPKFGYRFDEKNSEFTDRVKQRLASAIPEFQRNDSLEWFYVYLPKVVFPEEPYGYVEVVVGDPFYAERYADVFRKEDGAWHLIDSVGIASGTLDSLMTEFNWSAYKRDLKKRI